MIHRDRRCTAPNAELQDRDGHWSRRDLRLRLFTYGRCAPRMSRTREWLLLGWCAPHRPKPTRVTFSIIGPVVRPVRGGGASATAYGICRSLGSLNQCTLRPQYPACGYIGRIVVEPAAITIFLHSRQTQSPSARSNSKLYPPPAPRSTAICVRPQSHVP